MEREIKFRAWDRGRKMFVPQGSIIFNFYGDDYIEVAPNDMSYIGDSCHNGEPQRDRFQVSQFTGIRDKNGKEIYEGDILSGWKKGSNSDRSYMGIIEWRQDQAGWVIKCQKFILEILSLAQSGWAAEPYNIYRLDSFEVIGNIYENPELLSN